VNDGPVDLIARAVLYEGYLLYPYRPSAIKNRQRFNFGVLYPRDYCVEREGSERSRMQAECPVQGNGETRLEIAVRFLQLVERSLEGGAGAWQGAIEREARLDAGALSTLQRAGARVEFAFPGTDPASTTGETTPQTTRRSDDPVVLGEVRAAVDEVRPGAYRLSVRVANLSAIGSAATRDAALVRSLASAHIVIRVTGGELVSLLDPPEPMRDVAMTCANIGVWPVLVGEEGSRDCMLASPIILYDYPQVAAESPGDLFDGTEIDEILALRVLTMTEDEKREARESDERARQILDRTDALTPEHWARLHGAVRGLRKVTGTA
jgi:hypothetical protein